MSSANIATYENEYTEQQKNRPPTSRDSKCLTNENLQNKLNTDDFNKQMQNVISESTGFLNSYIQNQDNIKNNTIDRENKLYNERLWQTAINKRRALSDKHYNMMRMLKNKYNTTIQVDNSLQNTIDLYKMLLKQNIELNKTIKGSIHSIELSNRKTYYENEQNNWIGWWAHHFKTKYWLLIFLLIMGIILTKRTNETHLWIKVAGLAIYPYIAFSIISLIVGIWFWIRSDTKWVYLYSHM